MTVVGVDLSTFRVNTAWVMRGCACRWHVDLGTNKVRLIDRVRAVRMQWPLDVTEVVIEMPYGPNRQTDKSLMAVVGAITRSVPKQARVSWISSGDLRKSLGAKNSKESAFYVLSKVWPAQQIEGWDEHEMDALVSCLGWTRILNDQEAR